VPDDRWKASYDRWKTRSPDDDRPPDEYDGQPDEEEMTEVEQLEAEERGEVIARAARVLISVVRGSERLEGARSTHGELELSIDLTGGGQETWLITIERVASSH
jgi:hypothetical protein